MLNKSSKGNVHYRKPLVGGGGWFFGLTKFTWWFVLFGLPLPPTPPLLLYASHLLIVYYYIPLRYGWILKRSLPLYLLHYLHPRVNKQVVNTIMHIQKNTESHHPKKYTDIGSHINSSNGHSLDLDFLTSFE